MSRPMGLARVKSMGVPATGRMRPVGQVSALPSVNVEAFRHNVCSSMLPLDCPSRLK